MKKQLLVMAVLVASVVCAEEVVSSSALNSCPLDMRAIEVRAIGSTASDLFAFAHNNTADWRRGGDGTAAAATIRLTEMDAHGVTNTPAGWTELAYSTNLVCVGGEGLVTCAGVYRAVFRADLLAGGATNETAYFDFTQDETLQKSVSMLTVDPETFTVYYQDGQFRASGTVRDADGNLLVEGTDYRTEVVLGASGQTVGVRVIGLNGWAGSKIVPKDVREIRMSVSALDDVLLDTRSPDASGARVLDGAAELLPLARTSAKDWRRGGLDAVAATLAATPVAPAVANGQTVWMPVGEAETLETAAGEGVYAGWAPSGDYYRVTLATNGVAIESAVIDFTGGTPRAEDTVSVKNLNTPAIGKPFSVELTDSTGGVKVVTATWTRQSADKTSSTVVGASVTSYVPTAADLEHFLTVSVGGAGDVPPSFTQTIWFSKLPVVYVTTSDGGFPTASKEEHTGTFKLQGNATWTKEKNLYDGALEKIHVRGNTTSGYPKKPYKLKLDKKADLLGMGKNKHWVLLANWNDPGLMRNKTAYDLSEELGLTAMNSEWVDVVFNGQFVGNYQLCEHIRIGEDRIDIHNWEDTAEETATTLATNLIVEAGAAQKALIKGLTDTMTANLAWLTTGQHTFTNGVTYTLGDYGIDVSTFDLSGGYVYELDRFADELSMFRVTSGKINNTLIKVNSPETLYTNPELMAASAEMWTNFFASVQTENGYTNGLSWVERGNVKSMAAYWLTQVLMSQLDTYWSRYAYKPQGEPITFGPAWDFDHSIGGRAQGWTVNTNAEGVVTTVLPNAPTGWSLGVGAVADNFYGLWVDDPYFCLALYELWQAKKAYLFNLVADGGTLDQNYEYLLESGRANDAVWPVQTAGNATFPFEGENGNAKVMKRYLKAQIEWIDARMTSLRTLVASLKSNASDHPYTDSADKLQMAFPDATARTDSTETVNPDVIVKPGTDVVGTVAVTDANTATVEVYVNGLAVSTNEVQGGQVAYTVPTAFLTGDDRNLVALISRNSEGTLLHTTYGLVTTGEYLSPEDVVVTVGDYTFDPSDPEAVPTVTVAGTNGVTLVEDRDYSLVVTFKGDGTGEAVVTGLGNYAGTGLLPEQINFVGTVKKSFVGRVIPGAAVVTACLDTRAFSPKRALGSKHEVLPLAYDTAWWADATAIASLTVTPLTNGAPDVARQVAVPVAGTVGTSVWTPVYREVYRAEIRTQEGDVETVDIDLTEAPELPPVGSIVVGGGTWATIEGGVCTISGSGAMYDFASKENPLAARWEEITDVVVGDGVTHVGSYSFHKFFNLTNVTVSAGVASLGDGALFRCLGLEQVTFEGDLPEMGENALTIHAGIVMDGDKPVVTWVPNVTVNGESATLYGSNDLTAEDWEPVAPGDEKNYHFFKVKAE